MPHFVSLQRSHFGDHYDRMAEITGSASAQRELVYRQTFHISQEAKRAAKQATLVPRRFRWMFGALVPSDRF